MLAVVSSTGIERYLQLENQSSGTELDDLLRSKIFKEGFEESAFKGDFKEISLVETVDSFMTKKDHDSTDKGILKSSQEPFWQIVKEKVEEVKPVEEDLWNFKGIPTYIKTYLEQIKEFKGNFIDVFTEAR